MELKQMQNFLSADKALLGPAFLALGMFDGVHIGHRELLNKCAELSKEYDAQALAHTFIEHPRSLFGENIKLLNHPNEKAEIISSLGVIPDLRRFDRQTSQLEAEDFVLYLLDRYDLRGIVVGTNHRFGKNASGDSDFLIRMAKAKGFEICIVDPVFYKDEAVSSSRIRNDLEQGNIQEANEMLGMPYFFRGIIEQNKHIGTQIGYPTLNIDPSGKVEPKYGVYVSTIEIANESTEYNGEHKKEIKSVSNIGLRPTVEENDVKANIETHALEELGDLYGKYITVKLHSFIRPEQQFSSLDELKHQIGLDCNQAEQFFETAPLRQGRL